ncbi:MAG: hypothetical protein Q7R89_03495, partial [bacterium]|nr:hypothetical protein [bacterium]
METTTLLLQNNWKKALPHIQAAGENGSISQHDLGDDYSFWEELGIFEKTATGELSEIGKAIFESIYIRRDG